MYFTERQAVKVGAKFIAHCSPLFPLPHFFLLLTFKRMEEWVNFFLIPAQNFLLHANFEVILSLANIFSTL